MTERTKVGWLLDGDAFDYTPSLVAEIEAQGHIAKILRSPQLPYSWNDVRDVHESFPRGRCVITHGDIALVQTIQRAKRWRPGTFADFHNLRCSAYYCRFGEHLINGEYAMLPLGELPRCRKFLFQSFGRDGRIFVRPDSPLKTFTGQLLTRERFDDDLEFLGFHNVPPHQIVLVSRPQEILAEWRFVAATGMILAGCRYKSGGKFEPHPQVEPAARRLADRIALSAWQPDPVWIVDICQTADDEFRLLEIGGFSCASLYCCDLAAIVRGVSEVAMEIHSRT